MYCDALYFILQRRARLSRYGMPMAGLFLSIQLQASTAG
jgi:hypothetical protein